MPIIPEESTFPLPSQNLSSSTLILPSPQSKWQRPLYECRPNCIVATSRHRSIPDHHNLLRAFPKIPGLGSDQFILPASCGIYLKVQKQYSTAEPFPTRFFDPSLVWKKPTNPPPYYAMIAWCRQYRTSLTDWDTWYEPRTLMMLGDFLGWQELKIREAVRCQRPLTEEVLLLASALRILALTHEVADVWANLGDASEMEFSNMFNVTPKNITEVSDDPTISLSTCGEPADYEQGVDLSKLLHTITSLLQSMILRRRPSDWPTIIAVLAILKLSELALWCHLAYFEPLENVHHVENVVNDLCELFNSIDARHPLGPDWKAAHYVSLVGADSWAFNWSVTLRDLADAQGSIWESESLVDKIEKLISVFDA